tara:strand:+ start:16560 stop:17402 length:843 start_codon:yes stop_codon:yes gene_type:complete
MKYTDKYLPLSFSSLKAFAESPRAFVHYKSGARVTSPAMLKGTLIHRRILEPTEYIHTVEVWDGHRRGKAWTDFKEAQVGKDVVTRAESDVIEGAYHAVKAHPIAKDLIDGCTNYEEGVEWKLDGVPFRGFVDGYSEHYALDLKTMPDISPKAIERQVWGYKYFMQAALYRRGLHERGVEMKDYYIVAVQASAPHNVAVYRLDDAYLHRGDLLARELLEQFKGWDGKPTHHPESLAGVIALDSPSYAPPLELNVKREVYADKRTGEGEEVRTPDGSDVGA